VVPLSPSFDTVGLFARTDGADLLRAGASALAGGLPGPGSCSGVVLADDLLAELEPPDQAVIVKAAERLATALGVPLSRDSVLPCPAVDAAATFRTLQGAEAWRAHGELVSAGGLGLGPGIAARFRVASEVTADDEAAASEQREAIARALLDATADGRLVVQPAAAGPPPRLDDHTEAKAARRLATLALTAPAGLAGAPVGVLPARGTGAPLGLAIVAAPGRDALVLDALVTGAP
jgi:Asp-tRNA(Asn)/Glu-tRNA(Gln) amidotransferase A subunit family amidase